MSTALSIFDVDRTLTRRPTYAAFLLFAALRLNPMRLALAPALAPDAARYLLKRMPRKAMKEAMHRIALGRRLSRDRAETVAQEFADRLLRAGLYDNAIDMIAQERAAGRMIVLATAAPELYIRPLADRLGVDAVCATAGMWADGFLLDTIAGENCYGIEKLNAIRAWMRSAGTDRAGAHVRFFSDHVSDLPTFEWSDDPVMVNPSRRLAEIGAARNWKRLDWRR